jgi:hypothetical protein
VVCFFEHLSREGFVCPAIKFMSDERFVGLSSILRGEHDVS